MTRARRWLLAMVALLATWAIALAVGQLLGTHGLNVRQFGPMLAGFALLSAAVCGVVSLWCHYRAVQERP